MADEDLASDLEGTREALEDQQPIHAILKYVLVLNYISFTSSKWNDDSNHK